jgi:1-acyl-sn-glycerol-3-phosphate acyltransferase
MQNSSSGSVIRPINIREVFHEKNPRMARLLPGFIFRYLEKIVHQEDINAFLKDHGLKRNLDFAEAIIEDFNVSITIEGEENIPVEGRFIFAANHPMGGFDGVVMIKILSGYFKGFRVLVNDILMNLKNLQDLFIPINKHGSLAQTSALEIEKTFESDLQLLTYPAGYVSRRIKGQVLDLPWRKSFIVKAVKHKRDVIPVHFSGRCSNFFYNLARIRKTLGIKANIEMLYLVDESYRHKNEKITVKFGKPIPWQTFDPSRKPIEWAYWVKKQVYALDHVTNVPF